MPSLMPLTYRMTEELLRCRDNDGRRNVVDDEGVGCRANQLPRLLAVIVNILMTTAADDQVLTVSTVS